MALRRACARKRRGGFLAPPRLLGDQPVGIAGQTLLRPEPRQRPSANILRRPISTDVSRSDLSSVLSRAASPASRTDPRGNDGSASWNSRVSRESDPTHVSAPGFPSGIRVLAAISTGTSVLSRGPVPTACAAEPACTEEHGGTRHRREGPETTRDHL